MILSLDDEVGFMPGVAAGLLALAELAAQGGDRNRARALLDEAASIAAAVNAQGVLKWVNQARGEM